MWIHRTKKGRVVYDRKKHLWSTKDVSRVASKVPAAALVKVSSELWPEWLGKLRALEYVPVEISFGGGEFAGGGATRTFSGEITSTGITGGSEIVVFMKVD